MRKVQDWLSSYLAYAQDEFCPPKFHFWTGVSVLATAMERKVWVDRETFSLYPNLYVMLIGKPGVGKSSASNIGVNEFLKRLKYGAQTSINFLATKSSQAGFLEQAALWREFHYQGRAISHASSFLYASEASNSFTEIMGGGAIQNDLVELYDCPPHLSKKLVNKPELIIQNGCCNFLACSTFSFLKDLIPERHAAGGFASRLLYVVQRDLFVRKPSWSTQGRDTALQQKLLEDLVDIHTLCGEMEPTEEFTSVYEKWFPKHDFETQNLPSERMQLFKARKHTNLLKIAMICSVAESSALRLELRHWDRALDMYADLEKDLRYIVESSLDKTEHKSIYYRAMRTIEEAGQAVPVSAMTEALHKQGFPPGQFGPVLTSLVNSGDIQLIAIQSGPAYKLLGNPQKYL